MSALGEYYRGMGAAAMDQARAAHESAAASQTGADAQMVGQQGQANLHNAQAGMVKPLGESEIGLQTAQGGYYGAQAHLANENASMVRPLGESTIGYQGAMGSAALMHGRAAGVAAGAAGVAADAAARNAATGAATGDAQIRQMDQGSGAFATGTSRISAPGNGTVDTTKAKLANGEAVLNKGAAEHLGQPAIQALNAVGMLRMGMVPGQNTQAPQVKEANAAQTAGKTGAQGYAKGTSKAGPKKAAKTDAKPAAKDDKPAAKDAKSAPKGEDAGAKPSDTPSLDQIDPKMLAAAMQMGLMGQQGGGMPPPGGAPQQMPQGGPMPQGAPMGMM